MSSSILNVSFASATSSPGQTSQVASGLPPPPSSVSSGTPSSATEGPRPCSTSSEGLRPTTLQSSRRDLEIAELALGIANEEGDLPGDDKTDVDSEAEQLHPVGNCEVKDKTISKLKCPSCDNVAMVICSIFALSIVVASIALVTWLFLKGLSRLTY